MNGQPTVFWLKERARRHVAYSRMHRLAGRGKFARSHLNVAFGYTRAAQLRLDALKHSSFRLRK